MAITMKYLYEKSMHLYKMELLGGENGLDCPVEWIHMIENTPSVTFLHGHELIFITGLMYQGADWLLHYVKCLHQKNVAGLVVNIGPYIKKIPFSTVEFCNNVGFPIFVLPWEVHLVDFTRYLCRFIIEDEKKKQSNLAYIKQILLVPDQCQAACVALESQGFNTEGQFCIAVMHGDENYDLDEMMALVKLYDSASMTFAYHNDIVMVLNQEYWEEKHEKIKELLEFLESKDIYCSISIGAWVNHIAKLIVSYKQAVSIQLLMGNMKKEIMFYDYLGIYKLLLNGTPVDILRKFYDDTLGALVAYDQTHQSNLMETLQYYMYHDCSVKDTAAHEVVHRNTILYKFNKIEQILGISIATEESRLNVLMALKIKKIL